MTKHLVPAAAIILACAVVGHAQTTIAGTWQGETSNGTPVTLELAVDGGVLTGTVTRGDERLPISDGKVSKNTCTFKVQINDTTEGLTGELTGEELKVWLDRQGAEMAVVFKRVKK